MLREVVFQECVQRVNRLHYASIISLGDYFYRLFGLDGLPKPSQLIYISRGQAGHRKVSNEDEVIENLEHHGFRSLVLENMSFPDQVKAFAEAEIVVSIHGAGLANIAFMRHGSHVIGLTQPPHPNLTWRRRWNTYLLNPAFSGLSEIRGVHYDALFCELDLASTPHDVRKRMGPLHADIRVDIADLNQKIERTRFK